MRSPIKRGTQRGFTLIEVLVAFAILAMSLTVLYRIFSGGLSNISIAQRHMGALMLVQDLLEGTDLNWRELEGVERGESVGGYRWNRSVTPYERSDAGGRTQEGGLYQIKVRVSWSLLGRQRELNMSSLRLDPLKPPSVK